MSHANFFLAIIMKLARNAIPPIYQMLKYDVIPLYERVSGSRSYD